ncbi:YcnI family copper-binding membrane protein [Microlunatus elymi]|uniref:YcnI family copper-binding membrane protein n=1 Tax=Microlunatus elymi TaxID=2596828 RepID=UPI001AF01B1E|nr:YcnI family protein [Microlunatus elymi]
MAAILLALTIGFASAVPASAHVRVSSTDAVQGGYGVLTFRVPTESDTASTVGLIITLPSDTPISSVSTQPVPGWTATRTVKKLTQPITTDDGEIDSYISKITWKADAPRYGIKPGEFGQFSISAGPLPKTASIAFPTVQRYSDGSSVAWDEIASGSSAEPEHPAPTITLSSGATPTATSSPQPTDQPSDNNTDWLSSIAVGLAAVAVIISAIALLRSRRRD